MIRSPDGSKGHSESHLHDPPVPRRVDAARIRCADVRSGIEQVDEVEGVEGLETELHADTPDRKRPEQREVHVLRARPDQEVAG